MLRLKIKTIFVKDFLIYTKVIPKRMGHLQKEGIILSKLYFRSKSENLPAVLRFT